MVLHLSPKPDISFMLSLLQAICSCKLNSEYLRAADKKLWGYLHADEKKHYFVQFL